jgi:hypothetical protein
MKVCPECHGQGRIEDEDGNIVTCPECHGSGVVDDHHDDDPGTIREPSRMSATVAPGCDSHWGPCPQVQFPTAERRNASAPPPVSPPRPGAPISSMSRGADDTRRWTADLLAAIRSELMQAHLRTAASRVQG